MAKQTLERRIAGIIKDGAETDPQKRWARIVKDFQEDGRQEEIEKLYDGIGEMPEATLDDIPEERAVYYACRDADATLRINPELDKRIDELELRPCYEMDMAVIPMVERMQSNGMLVDVPYFERLGEEFRQGMEEKKRDIERSTGWWINPDSGDQTAFLLYDVLGIKAPKLTEGGKRGSTNDKLLESLRSAHPAVGLVCDHRELSKLRNTFARVLPRLISSDGRIRANLRVTRVSSGRLSATKPNLLGIPVRTSLGKKIREGFIAPEGCVLGGWDLDQIEMREMAHQSEDPVLCDLFIKGKDVHRSTAAWVFGVKLDNVTPVQRRVGKTIGFGVMYGITEIGLCAQLLQFSPGWTEESCKKALEEWFKLYKGVKSFQEQCYAEARRFGFVRDRWGRIRYLPGVHASIPGIREEALRQSVSFKISASAQGIMKKAQAAIWQDMRECWRVVDRWWEPLLQVHDELLFELSDEPEFYEVTGDIIIHRLCNTTSLRVPIKAKGSIGPNWAALKD